MGKGRTDFGKGSRQILGKGHRFWERVVYRFGEKVDNRFWEKVELLDFRVPSRPITQILRVRAQILGKGSSTDFGKTLYRFWERSRLGKGSKKDFGKRVE